MGWTESTRQKQHYEQIHDAYADHYFDRHSMAYRDRFIYRPLFEGLDLNGKDVADLACGSGGNSIALRQLYPDVRLTGYDISAKACADYRERVGQPAVEADLTKAVSHGATHDVALIIGGLHHCIVDLPSTLRNVAALIKPDGLLLMMEPNADFLLEGVRKLWYRHDPYFDAETEHALSHDSILQEARGLFDPLDLQYLGGPGYFLILSSMILRMPKPVKSVLAQPFSLFDVGYNKLPGRAPFPYFLARWRRRPDAESSV